MSGQPELLAAGLTVKSLPMTINDGGRNMAQAGRALHAPAEARRAFRDLGVALFLCLIFDKKTSYKPGGLPFVF